MNDYSRLSPEQQAKITEAQFLSLPSNIQSLLIAAATASINVDEILAVLQEVEASREEESEENENNYN